MSSDIIERFGIEYKVGTLGKVFYYSTACSEWLASTMTRREFDSISRCAESENLTMTPNAATIARAIQGKQGMTAAEVWAVTNISKKIAGTTMRKHDKFFERIGKGECSVTGYTANKYKLIDVIDVNMDNSLD